MAEHTVKVPAHIRLREYGTRAAEHVGGMQVVKTTAELGLGFVGARLASHYADKSGMLDFGAPPAGQTDTRTAEKIQSDKDMSRYVRAGGLVAIGAVMVMKTQRARVPGLGVIIEGLSELIVPTLDKTVDDLMAPPKQPSA